MKRIAAIANIWAPLTLAGGMWACGCGSSPGSEVSIERDPDAVLVRLHNRTGMDLILKPSVRHQTESLPLDESFRMTPTDEGGPSKDKPDLEMPVFKYLPMKPQNVGAYSLDVMSEDSDVRLTVIDVTRQEMDTAKEEGRLTYVFRTDAVTVVVGTTTKTVPWLRPLPGGYVRTKP